MWLTMSGASVYLDDSDKLLNHLLSVSPALEYCPEHSRHSVNIRWTNFKWFSCYFPNLVCLGYAGPLLLNIKCKLLDFLVPIRTPGRTAVVNEQLLSARPVLSTMWISCQCFTKCGSRPRALSMIRCLLKVLNMSNTELLNLPQNLLFQFPPYQLMTLAHSKTLVLILDFLFLTPHEQFLSELASKYRQNLTISTATTLVQVNVLLLGLFQWLPNWCSYFSLPPFSLSSI